MTVLSPLGDRVVKSSKDTPLACVASVSVQFESKELQGDEWRFLPSSPLPPPFFFWLSPHFPRRQNTENPVPRLYSQTLRKRLLRRLTHHLLCDVISLLSYSRVADSLTKYCKISYLHIELLETSCLLSKT